MNMGRTNKCNLREDETLAEAVKKYDQFEVFWIHFVKEMN